MATVATAAEQRIVLHNISWETYEWLLADHENASAPRFTYDRGELEIMSPLPEHEEANRSIATLVELVGIALGGAYRSLGSTTFRREDLERGFEPDSCFYFQNEPAVRGKERIDLSVDPAPDVAIEIDTTRSSIDKLGLFATLGVGEVWRYDGNELTIVVLDQGRYTASVRSRALPFLSVADLNAQIGASTTMNSGHR